MSASDSPVVMKQNTGEGTTPLMMSTKTDAAPAENASASTAVASQLKSDFEGQVVRINVRNSSHSISCLVHKQLLQDKSSYFAALPNFREGTENEVTLDDLTPNAFKNLVHWFYRDCLDPKTKDDPEILVGTWIAADRLLMCNCKNATMDQLRLCYQGYHSTAMILEVVEVLEDSPEVPLVQYLTDQVAFDCISSSNEENEQTTASSWPPLIRGSLAFILTTKIIAVAQKWRGGLLDGTAQPVDPSKSPGCVYHHHIEGEECHLKQETEVMSAN